MSEGKIMTVLGPIEPAEITAMVTHEHVVHRFGDPPSLTPDYDMESVKAVAVPALNRLKKLGCNTIVDATTVYFGRSVQVLQRLSEMTGVHIIANTGYYGAADDRYVPEHAYSESADQLAARWTDEWERGIDGTEVRPGFIKIGVDHPGPLSEIDAKLVRAGAIAHRNTGLVVEIHSPQDGSFGDEELAIFEEEGVAPGAWIWVHADTVEEMDDVVAAASRGGWVEFDSIKIDNLDDRVARLERMKKENLLSQVLLSHDEASYEPGRSDPVPVHTTVFTHLIPRLRESGFDESDIIQMTTENPRNAFAIGVRT